MTLLAASLLALHLVPAAALKQPAIPTPGPETTVESAGIAALRLPAAQRPRYEIFRQKCGRCHPAERALDARLSADQWDDYLKRKYKRAGMGISDAQAREIDAFLRYWATAKR